MDTSKIKIREFYENYYSQDSYANPAFIIYDHLRISKINDALTTYSSEGNLLIIGCGSKKDSKFLDMFDESYGFDLSLNAIKKIKLPNRKLFVADATNLPLMKDFFDSILISEVIEHIPNVNIVVQEVFRVGRPQGKIIISTPNWISFFGLFRWIADFFLKKRITSDNQPYDDWKTIKKIKSEFSPYFKLLHSSGIWYLPPLHYKNNGLSQKITDLLFKIFSPFEKFLSSNFPHLGHLLFLVFISNK